MKRKPPTTAEIARVMGSLGSIKSKKKAQASRENGKRGGRPKGKGKKK